MTAARAIATSPLADPLDVFEARCWARAYLWACGDYDDLLECVDTLWEAAERTGVVSRIGADAAQAILSAEFQRYRGAAPC